MNKKKKKIILTGLCLIIALIVLSFPVSFSLSDQEEVGTFNDFVTPEQFGAVGDGQTDDAPAINAALESGKPVKLGDKTYLTKSSIFVPSNSELYGSSNSKILNDVQYGYEKNAIVVGLAGSAQTEGSSITIPKYEVTGDHTSTTLNVANANSIFKVGDTVLFTDGEILDNRAYRFVDAAKVIKTTASTITIDNRIINDKLLQSQQLYAINFSKISEYHSSEFNRDLYLANDVYIHDITIEMKYPETGSGMYGIYTSCVDCKFENIKMNNVTTPVGSNAFIRSILNNVTATYSGGITDMAEVQIRSVYSNLDYTRIGHNANHQNEGFVVNNGYLAYVYNVNIDNLDMAGAFRSVNIYDITYENCSYKTTASQASNNSWMFMVNSREFSTTIINCKNDSSLYFASVYNISSFDSVNGTAAYDTTNDIKIARMFYDGTAFFTSKTKWKTMDYYDKSVIFIVNDVELNDSNILGTKLINNLIYSEDGYTTTINGGIFDNQYFSIKKGTLIINGGTYYKPIYVNGDDAHVIINGGTFLADSAIHLINGTVEINDGVFKNGVQSINAEGGTLTVNDGKFTSYGISALSIKDTNVTLTKGDIKNERIISKYIKSGAIQVNSNQEIEENNYLRTLVTEGKKLSNYELTKTTQANSYNYLSNKNIKISTQTFNVIYATAEDKTIKEVEVDYNTLVTQEDSNKFKVGYTATGYYSNKELTTPFDFNTKITSNTKIYVKLIPNTYKLTLDDNNNNVTEVDVTYDQTYENKLPTPQRANYQFAGWYLDNGTFTNEVSETDVVNITKATTLYAKWVDVNYVYSFIEGKNQKYIIGKSSMARFRIDADYSLFEADGKVYVDNKELTTNQYTSKPGSIIITLLKNYVDTLKEGTHELKVTFNNKSVTTTFKVTKQKNNDNVVIEELKNNDNTTDNTAIYIIGFTVSFILLAGLIVALRKK